MTLEDKLPVSEKPVWLITGCSTGFGHELARQTLELGYRTVVTARNPQQVSALAVYGDALVLELDIQAVESNPPPHRLLLGNGAYDGAVGKLDQLRDEFHEGEAVARAADH